MEQTNQIRHEDITATIGFEKAGDNVIPIWPGDCPHCLLPFNRPTAPSNMIKVWTARGVDHWCASCVEEGVRKEICLLYRKLDKKTKKQLEKSFKNK